MAVAREGIVKFKIMEHNCKKADFAEFIAGLNAPADSRILMDNVAFHRSECVREALRKKGFAPMYIPAYSPRMNAIENVFGAVKQEYRANCPLAATADVNYVSIFEDVLDRWKQRSLTLFFDRVSHFVAETLASGGKNFSGHDV
jgi:transposase